MAPPSDYLEPSFGSRFLARLLDGLILLVPLVLLAVLFGNAGSFLGLLATAAYEISFVSRDGQTIGKRVLHIKVVDAETGAVPTVDQAARRWFVLGGISWLLSVFLPPLVGFAYDIVVLVLIIRPPLHQGPHDLAARTIVTAVH